MLSSISNKIPVLVVEDKESDLEAIKTKLGKDYELEHYEFPDDIQLLNYKALKQDNQIVVSDLKLKYKKEEGINIIRKKLWTADRTTFFVIFTEHHEILDEISFEDIHPNWTVIIKEYSDVEKKHLNDRCLSRLKETVDELHKHSPPLMTTPQFIPYRLQEQMDQFIFDQRGNLKDSLKEYLLEPLIYSVEIMNSTSIACSVFNRAGMDSSQIGIAIYGSSGRLEARKDSDVEFSVYYAGKGPCDLRSLAVILWNRVMFYCRNYGLKYEGDQLIKGTDPQLLQDDSNLPNVQIGGYVPIIGADELFEYATNPIVKVRHLQILTEAKPVFNQDFILELKKRLIQSQVDSRRVPDIVSGSYFPVMCRQYFEATHPEQMAKFKDFKEFCYRVQLLMGLQLFMVQCLKDETLSKKLDSDKDWNEFFDYLSSPALSKMIKFYLFVRDAKGPDDDERKELLIALFHFIETCLDNIRKLWDYAEQQEKPPLTNLYPDVHRTIDKFNDLRTQMLTMDYFKIAKEKIVEIESGFGIGNLNERMHL